MTPRLSSVEGQARVVAMLRAEVEAGRLHHAHVFAGPGGVGKRLVARALLASLNCERSAEGRLDDACGQCASCRRIGSGNDPDLREVAPDGRFIKIDQVREILAETRYRPSGGRWRMVVIDDADLLRDEAANALLKTLEEPGQGTLFALVTSRPDGLLETIRSRAVPIRFAPLPREVVARLLVAGGVPADAAATAASLSRGGLDRARATLDSAAFAARGERASRLLGLVEAGDGDALAFAETLSKAKDELPGVLVFFAELARDAALLRAGASAERLLHADLREQSAALAARAEVSALARIAARADEARDQLRGNIHPLLATEGFVLDSVALVRASMRRQAATAPERA